MKLTIIVDDRLIKIDNEGFREIQEDMSWIPSDVHAIQWNGDTGHIEYKTGKPNETITELGIYEKAVEILSVEKLRREREEIESQIESQEAIDLITDWTNSLRKFRNYRLTECDWTQILDNTLTEDQKAAWRTYRQLLRDLPDTASDPKSLVKNSNHPDWPTPPG